MGTRATLEPRPSRLSAHPLPPAGRLPCQVQLSRPKQIPADKDTAFQTGALPWAVIR